MNRSKRHHVKIEEIEIREDIFLSQYLFVKDIVLTMFSNENTVEDIQLEFRGKHLIWEKIISGGPFSHSEEICGTIMGGRFSPKKDFIFTVRMKSEQKSILSILADSPSNAIETLLKSKDNPAFSQQESYLLTSVMQHATPKTQWGMTTSFCKGFDK